MSIESDRSMPMAVDDDEVSVRELVQILWRQRWLIASATTAFAVLAAIVSLLQENMYEATVVVSPIAKNTNGGGLGGIVSQFGGIASLAGLSLGSDNNKAEAIAVLQSQMLTARYVEENDLLPILFVDRWDAATKTWKVTDPDKAPTLWKANEIFKRIREVTEDRRSGLITLTVRWTDPKTCSQWANGLVKMTNDILRQKAIEESDRHVEYLNQQAARTDLAQVRTAIYSVLESEIKNVMLAKGPGDYALKVIDPAVPPEQKSSPKRVLWVLIGALGGLVLSFVVVLLRTSWNAAPSSGGTRLT